MEQGESTIGHNEGESRKTIRQRREALGLTQIRLAALAGINLSTLTLFENGRQNIKLATYGKILAGLTAAEAGARTTENLRAQADMRDGSARPTYSLIPPREGTPERIGWEESFLNSSPTFNRQLAQLRQENAFLLDRFDALAAAASDRIANLNDRITKLEEINTKLEEINNKLEQVIEAYQKMALMDEEKAVIDDATIKALKKSVPKKTRDAKGLIQHRKRLAAAAASK